MQTNVKQQLLAAVCTSSCASCSSFFIPMTVLMIVGLVTGGTQDPQLRRSLCHAIVELSSSLVPDGHWPELLQTVFFGVQVTFESPLPTLPAHPPCDYCVWSGTGRGAERDRVADLYWPSTVHYRPHSDAPGHAHLGLHRLPRCRLCRLSAHCRTSGNSCGAEGARIKGREGCAGAADRAPRSVGRADPRGLPLPSLRLSRSPASLHRSISRQVLSAPP